MASFAMEFELIAGNQEINFLEKRFNTGSNIYNLCLDRCIKQLNKLKRDKEYRKSVKALKTVNRKLEKKSLPQDEIKRLKDIKISCTNKIKELEKEYQFTENDIQKYAKVPREFIGKILNSAIVQNIASTAFDAVKKIQYRKAKKVKFKKKSEISLEGKTNKTGFIFDTKTMKLKIGKKLFCNLKTIDGKQKNCFKNRIKFCRILKRYIRGKKRYFLQIVFEGIPETDFQIGEGEVGLDIGTSTVAISSNDEVKFLKLSETEQEARKIRILQRSLERKRRMANPDNYDENGKVKKKMKEWKLSKNYFRELNKLKEIYRKKRVKDNQHKNILVKFILS
jgi:putative IS transposase